MRLVSVKKADRAALAFRESVELLLDSPQVDRELYGGKLSGAVRRASMELTRALAEMRKP
jgi:hypothetical protein